MVLRFVQGTLHACRALLLSVYRKHQSTEVAVAEYDPDVRGGISRGGIAAQTTRWGSSGGDTLIARPTTKLVLY